MTQYFLSPGLTSTILNGGQSVQVANSDMGANGGLIVNPLKAIDQGIHTEEPLFINLTGLPAQAAETIDDTILMPGQWFVVPPNTEVWVNALTSGHKFTAFFSSPYTIQFPPTVVPGQPGSGSGAPGSGAGEFPPLGVTGLTSVIPSYLYQEYTDDDDLQGFVDAQNEMQQNYIDTFNSLNLPIYTGPIVSGKLLDWVARGVYGMSRPAIGVSEPQTVGPLNTWGCNMLNTWFQTTLQEFPQEIPTVQGYFGLNIFNFIDFGYVIITNDDLFRRILTWHFFKGDGNYFSTRWIKRRVWRFCYGLNGVSPDFAVDPMTGLPHKGEHGGAWADPDDKFISNTDQISVSIGANRNVTIRFVLLDRTQTGGAVINEFGCNGFGPSIGALTPDYPSAPDPLRVPQEVYPITLNDAKSVYHTLDNIPFMDIFKKAVDYGVLELPYQFNYTVHIG